MSWSSYWIKRARRSAKRQRLLYGMEVPPVLAGRLQQDSPRLGPGASLQVMVFVFFSSLRGRLRLLVSRLADLDTPGQLRRIEVMARTLRTRSGCRIATGAFERRNYSRDMARIPRLLEKTLYRTRPLLAVQPRCEGDVLATLQFARERGLPVFPRGVSSSAFGGAVPTQNGIVMDFSAMTGILALDHAGLTARLQPGVRWADLAAHLEPLGLAPVTTPSSRFSTVGGWASTGGLGMDGFGYGHFIQAVAALRIALVDGRVLQLASTDDGFRDFVGTEGQLGVITELVLRVKAKSGYSSPKLMYFEDAQSAFECLECLKAGGHRPSHVAFYDRERMSEENRLFRERTGLGESIVEERESLLLHFDSAACERDFAASPQSALGTAANGAAARYLWSERFFPLKAQRLGPGLLACEVVLPAGSVPGFIDRVRRLAARFELRPAIEAIVSHNEQTEACVVIASFSCDPTRLWNYCLRLALVQILVHQAMKMKGRPYGMGIWNAPFFAGSYSAEERRRLLRRKRELDPRHLLNPRKFFEIRTRFFNIPGLIFRPAVFQACMQIATALSPLLGAAARIGAAGAQQRWDVPPPEQDEGRLLLRQAALRCTSCGSCVSACPAYLLTHDELVTGRAKLRMAEAWLAGEEIRSAEAHRIFQCLDCGLCEEVCQTHLPLRKCYEVLERWVEERHGSPRELIQTFVQSVDANRELLLTTFGLELPQWSPVPGYTVPQGQHTQAPSQESRV